MKNSEIETVYNIFENIPKEFSISLQIQILKNKKVLESEFNLISTIKKILYTEQYIEFVQKVRELEAKRNEKEIDLKTFSNRVEQLNSEYQEFINIQNKRVGEFEKYLKEDFVDSEKLEYVAIDDIPDDINNFEQTFIDGLLLITK